MDEELFEEKISKEEQTYQTAVALQNAVSCVLRFERKVASRKSAARKFEKIGAYKDAPERMEACREEAKKVEEEGCKKTFEEAKAREQRAKTKSDYVDAITEFRRVKKKEAYAEEAKEHIQACKKQIVRLENRAVWKRRFTVIGVIAVCVLVFINTPLYPFAKGYVHQQMGEYRVAIANYEEASALSWSKELTGACYYKMGKQKLEEGKKEHALKLFRKAKKYGNIAAKQDYHKLKKELQ